MNDDTIKTLVPLAEFKKRKAASSRLADKYIGKDGEPPSPDVERALHELAEMSPAEYGRRRAVVADKVGTSRTFLDAEYRERRKAAKDGGDSEFLRDPDPWPDPVKGEDLLDEIRDTATNHIVLPEGGAEIIALWVLFTHCHDCFDISTLLACTSPTPECGKSTCLTLLGCLTRRALNASNISPASVFRSVEKWKPTLLIDEADTFIRDNDDLRGILNSGHHRSGAFVIRTTGDNHEPKQFCTWGPKAIALIGKLPPTLASRAIHIELKRMLPGDCIEPLRLGRTKHLDPLLRKAARWAEDHANDLRAADPGLPESLYGRAADNWRPLIAIADCVGGNWSERSRQIAEMFSGRSEDLATIMILHDVAALFGARGVDRMSSEEVVNGLVEMEGRPWPEWGKNQKPITKNQLAKLLDGHGVVPTTIRLPSGKTPKGYYLKAFSDALTRYPPSPPFQNATTPQPLQAKEFGVFQTATDEELVAFRNVEKYRKLNACGGVAVENPSGACFEDVVDGFEERAAILEYDGGFTRVEAEARAAMEMPDLPAFQRRVQ